MQLTSNKWFLRCDDVEHKAELFDHAESIGLPTEPGHKENGDLIIGIGAITGKLIAMKRLNWDEGERIDEDWFYSMCDDYASKAQVA